MNPLTNIKNITKLNETELATGSIHKKSWHDMYKDSAWIFIGGLEYGLTEGDVIAVFSQYGEIENINLVRDKKTGKSKGYCFLCYSNQKSTVLAVDNFNGIKLCKRTIRVDHVANYKPPKENERDDEITKALKSEGCAPQVVQKLITKEAPEGKNDATSEGKSKKKSKKEKKDKKKKKRKHKSDSGGSDKETCIAEEVKVKKEKHDSGYDKYDTSSHENRDSNKRLDQRRLDNSNGKYSHSNQTDRSKIISTKYFKSEMNNELNRYKPKIKTEPESDKEYFRASRDNIPSKESQKVKSEMESRNSDINSTLSRKHKRKRSSSLDNSDDQADDNRQRYRLKNDRDDLKKSLKHKMKSKNVEDSSSSSSDDASSTQSSSEDEKQYSSKDKYKTHHKNKSNREDHRIGDSYMSSKNKHYDKAEKHADYKSKTIYKHDDRRESYSKDSHYHKRKSNK